MGVAEAFSAAADYDAHAVIQRIVADRLAARLSNAGADVPARVLEIGCGTGFVGDALIGGGLRFSRYVMTDLAPGMVARAWSRFGRVPNVRCAVMDAAVPSEAGPFDLICSSLAMQWLDDLPAAVAGLRRLLAPAGTLAFTTLAAGSFAEWRDAHGAVRPGTPDYPSVQALQGMGLEVSTEILMQTYPNGRAFLRALKAIGAGTPQRGYTPLPPHLLRTIMARFEKNGARATYVVATCTAGPLGSAR